jgi:hypothetical protein
MIMGGRHVVVTVVLLLLMLAGAALLGYAIVIAARKARVPKGRIWGISRRLPREAFATYFGMVGAAFIVTAGLALTVPAWVTAPALITAVLVMGWLVMAIRKS